MQSEQNYRKILINLLSWQKSGNCLNVKLCMWEEQIKSLQITYVMDGQTWHTVDSEKDLGVMISSDLKSSNQCIQPCSKANKMLGMIKRTISYKKLEIMVRLYKTLVRPHLEYCVSLWSLTTLRMRNYWNVSNIDLPG